MIACLAVYCSYGTRYGDLGLIKAGWIHCLEKLDRIVKLAVHICRT